MTVFYYQRLLLPNQDSRQVTTMRRGKGGDGGYDPTRRRWDGKERSNQG